MVTMRRSLAWLAAIWLGVIATAASAQTPDTRPRDTARQEAINQGTVGIISGGVAGTYIRIAADLAAVLDDGDNLRVLPVIGKGSVQNITDVLYLRGIDIGIVQSDVLTYVRRQNLHGGVEKRVHFITKLYNEEFHLLVRSDVKSIEELAGKKVNFDSRGSGTFLTASIVFETLNVKVEPVTFDQALALEKLKSGEISGLVYVAGKPTTLFRDLRAADNVKFLTIPFTPELLETYFPSRLAPEDYPNLIESGQAVDTLAVGAVMAVFNWEPDSVRYRKVAKFVDAFFTRFADFQKPPRHAKWQEVSLTAQVPGWTRFKAADDWIKRRGGAAAAPKTP
jgi:TRAP transporter TAXI family solute receptor